MSKFGTKEIVELWGRLKEAGTEGDDWSRPKHGGWVCKKPLELIVDGKSLGLIPRLVIIRETLQIKRSTFFEEAKVRSSAKDDRLMKTSNLSRHFQLANHNNARVYDLFFDGIVALLNDYRRDRGVASLLSEEDVFAKEFADADAPEKFAQMLVGSKERKRPVVEDAAFVFDKGNDRLGTIKSVKEALRVSSADEPRHRLINIHARDLWAGLSACADHIASLILSEGQRPVLKIPLRRPADARGEASRLEVLSLPEIIGRLRAFVDGDDDPGDNAPPFTDDEGLFGVISRIRKELYRRPSVLIFDGYYESGPGYSHLERYVNDDYLDKLITRLLDPPICSYADDFDIQTFEGNQIIVTSNRQMDLAIRMQDLDVRDKPLILELAPPDKEDIVEVLDHQRNLRFSDEVRAVILGDKRLREHATDVAWLVDAMAGAVKLCTETVSAQGVGEALSDGLHDRGTLHATIMHRLLDALARSRPDCREVLYLVALAPDGMRMGTVRGFAHRSMEIAGEARPFPSLAEAFCQNRLDELVEDVCSAMHSVFGRVRTDLFEGVDEVTHPHEMEYAKPGEKRALDFIYPELKAAVRLHAMKAVPPLQFHAAQRILAEEALRQQTISLRHVDRTNAASVRPWRRMLSAFYHGLQSLPIELVDGKVRIAKADFGGRDFVFFKQPQEFWSYLYAFCYRRMLERPPAWNLSRLHALDELKIELLAAFDRPWTLWPAEFQGPVRPDGEEGLLRGPHGKEQLVRDWAISLAQAQVAVGDLSEAEKTLARYRNVFVDTPTAIKREIDIAILKCERIDDKKILDQVASLAGFPPDVMQNIKTHVDEVAAYLNAAWTSKNEEANEGGIPNASDLLGELLGTSKARDRASDIADLFFRLAEVQATRADLCDARWEGRNLENQIRQLAILHDGLLRSEPEIGHGFCVSLANYRVAEQLRLRAFSNDMTGGNFFASGHQTRVAIRVALKLEAKRRQRGGPQGQGEGLFARFARSCSDTLTRHLFRYPIERANQLILEATVMRLLSTDADRYDSLLAARQFLGAAEELVLGVGRRARVRLRLALERNKVHRSLCDLHANGEIEQARRYYRQSMHDVEYMKAHAKDWGLPLWRILSAIQDRKLNGVGKKLGMK